MLCAIVMIAGSVKNIRHAKRFPVYPTERGRKIGKSMGVLMGITYIVIFTMAAILGISGNDKFIMSAIALIIGVHFIPIGKIIDVKANYYVAPLPILSEIIGLYFGLQTDLPWTALYAVSGTGGAAKLLLRSQIGSQAIRPVREQFSFRLANRLIINLSPTSCGGDWSIPDEKRTCLQDNVFQRLSALHPKGGAQRAHEGGS